MKPRLGKTVAALTVLMAIGAAHASPWDANPTPEKVAEQKIYSPYVNRDYPDKVLFGDTHFHTELSFDAGLVGTSLDVTQAWSARLLMWMPVIGSHEAKRLFRTPDSRSS